MPATVLIYILYQLFLANVNSRSRSLLWPSVCHLSSVTFVHPTPPIEIFGNFLRHLVLWSSIDIHENFTKIVPREPLRRRV